MLDPNNTKANLRPENSPKDSYHDKVFENEINESINLTKAAYEGYGIWNSVDVPSS